MDILLSFLRLLDKIFNTDILEELSKTECIAQMVPWLAGIIMNLFNTETKNLWIIAIILGIVVIFFAIAIIIIAIKIGE